MWSAIGLGLFLAIALAIWMVVRAGRGRAAREDAGAGTPEDAPLGSSEDVMAAMMGGVVLLRDNDWTGCAFDDMTADWSRMTRQGARGFHSVCSGRHAVRVERGAEIVEHDFTLYPGETYIRRLASGEFIEDEPETEAKYRALARGGLVGAMSSALVNYSLVSIKAGERPAPKPAQVRAALLDLLAETNPSPQPERVARAGQIGRALVGSMSLRADLRAFVGVVDLHASAKAITSDFLGAIDVADIGLALLPGDPFLLELKASLVADGGDPQAGLALVEAALRRPEALGPEGVGKATATRDEILGLLARRD